MSGEMLGRGGELNFFPGSPRPSGANPWNQPHCLLIGPTPDWRAVPAGSFAAHEHSVKDGLNGTGKHLFFGLTLALAEDK